MSAMVSQITGVSIVCSTVCSGAHQRKHQSSASLAFVRGIHRWPVNSPHKRPVTRKMFPFDDAIMKYGFSLTRWGRAMHICISKLIIIGMVTAIEDTQYITLYIILEVSFFYLNGLGWTLWDVQQMQQWEVAVYLIGCKQLILFRMVVYGCSSGCSGVLQIRVSS